MPIHDITYCAALLLQRAAWTSPRGVKLPRLCPTCTTAVLHVAALQCLLACNFNQQQSTCLTVPNWVATPCEQPGATDPTVLGGSCHQEINCIFHTYTVSHKPPRTDTTSPELRPLTPRTRLPDCIVGDMQARPRLSVPVQAVTIPLWSCCSSRRGGGSEHGATCQAVARNQALSWGQGPR